MKLGKPIKYIAIPPGEVVDRVRKHMNVEVRKKSSAWSQSKVQIYCRSWRLFTTTE